MTRLLAGGSHRLASLLQRPLIRARRWARRTRWFVREVGVDFGIGRGWLLDNPFLAHEIRKSTRGPALAVHCALLVIALSAVMLSLLNLYNEVPRQFARAAAFAFHMHPVELVLSVVALCHLVAIGMGQAQAISRDQRNERRRRMLMELLIIPSP